MKNGEKRYLVEIHSMGCAKTDVTVLFSFEVVGRFVYNQLRIGRMLIGIQAQEWADGKWLNYC